MKKKTGIRLTTGQRKTLTAGDDNKATLLLYG